MRNKLKIIVNRILNPSIPEVRDYIKYYYDKKYCRDIRYMSDQSIRYHVGKLESREILIRLECGSGYKNRYANNNIELTSRNSFYVPLKYIKKIGIGVWEYLLGEDRYKLKFYNKPYYETDYSDVEIIYDKEFMKYFIMFNRVIVGVINRHDKKNITLPSYAYGKGKSDYIRCTELYHKNSGDRSILSIKGIRRIV